MTHSTSPARYNTCPTAMITHTLRREPRTRQAPRTDIATPIPATTRYTTASSDPAPTVRYARLDSTPRQRRLHATRFRIAVTPLRSACCLLIGIQTTELEISTRFSPIQH